MLELLAIYDDEQPELPEYLDALLFTPDQPTRSIAFFIPGLHGPVLGGRHDYRPLAKELNERGYALLLLNMRSANTFWYALFEDCANDIAAAIRHVKGLGYSDIALFGTSLGGPRVVYTITHRPDPAIKVLGINGSVKSMYLEAELRKTPEEMAAYDACLARARELVENGQWYEGVTLLDYFPGRHMTLQARSLLSFFGTLEESNCSTIKFGDQVTVPTLVCHGEADEVIMPANGQAIYDSLVAAPKRDMVWVPGATHYLQLGWIAETYGRIMAEWIAENMPVKR